MRLLALVLVGAMLQIPGPGTRPGTPARARASAVGLNLARMDAIAVDAQGRLVKDLGPTDFEIIEDGSPRPIEDVRFVGVEDTPPTADDLGPIDSTDEEQKEAAREGTRLFAFFLDEYHVSAGPGVERVRAAITEFVDRNVGPRDLALIVKPLDSLPNLRLTRDRVAIHEAIASFDGRKGDYTPRTAFEQDYIVSVPPRVDQVRAQIVTSALNAIAEHLGSLRGGRKTIIVVSEGFSRPARRRTDPIGLPTVDTVIHAANRSGVSIYPIDPRALAPDAGPAAADQSGPPAADAGDRETLRVLARETDGHAIFASGDLSQGLHDIVSDSSGYYVIAFQPAYDAETGRFHPVAARVTRPGVSLRTRTGYWEPLPDAAAALRKLEPAVPPMPRHASPLIQPWFGFTRADDGKTRVEFVWEPAPRIPGDPSRTGTPSRIWLNVLNADGTLAFTGTVGTTRSPADVEQPGGRGRTDVGPGDNRVTDDNQVTDAPRAFFDVEPGRLFLRMQIEDDSMKLLDTDVRDLLVGRVAGPVALGTPLVLRARSAREFRALEVDLSAVPVVGRQFSRTERLLIRLPVYASQGPPTITARLSTAKGQVMRQVAVTAVPQSTMWQSDVPLSGLSPAEYHLEFMAQQGDASARESLIFRVTP